MVLFILIIVRRQLYKVNKYIDTDISINCDVEEFVELYE